MLEKQGMGLNLTVVVRDGILNHRTAGSPHTLEGKVVRLSDKIAYINHDIDDAIRGGILTEEDIPLDYRRILGFTTRERLNTLIHDMIRNSEGVPDIRMSAEVEEAMKELRQFMFTHVYTNPRAKGEEKKAINMLEGLFMYYMEHPDLLPEQFKKMLSAQCGLDRVVCDYIAGMTDQFAIAKFTEFYIPSSWQVY